MDRFVPLVIPAHEQESCEAKDWAIGLLLLDPAVKPRDDNKMGARPQVNYR